MSVDNITCPNAAALRLQGQYLTFPDSGDVHGALLALSELAAAFGAKSDDSEMLAARRKVIYSVLSL